MSDDFDERVITHFQRFLPLVTSIAFLLLAYVPINFSLFYNIRPDFGLMCIYFWMLHRPDLIGIGTIVVMGMVCIIISSSVVGASLIAYLVMYVLMYNFQKLFNAKPFVVIWYGFMALSFVAVLVKWLVASVYHNTFLPLPILMLGYLIGIVMYPLVAVVLAFIQNRFIQDDGL